MFLPDRRIEIVLVVAIALIAGWVRFVGLTRGTSDFVLSEASNGGVNSAFYTFHPDEQTLINAALALDWRSPIDPPLTAYGLLSLYMARAALYGERTLDTEPAARSRIYLRVRLLAALLSCALPAMVFWLGRRVMGMGPALLAASFTAFTPLAIQQAHFFTVDGIFAFFALAFFCALSWALERPTRVRYLLVGLIIGAAAAVRLNGVLLGLMLVVGHCSMDWRQVPTRLRDPRLWLAVGGALGVLLLLQPYLLLDPGRLTRVHTTNDFAYSLQVAQGEVLRPWSLVDLHTVPYAHYWTHLWPQSAGWPLTCFFAGGLLLALWRRRADPMLVWCLVYFALVGGLHTKHVRYLLPLLPFLSLFAADLCRVLWSRQRLVGGVGVALLVGYTVYFGLAFSAIYRDEDSRIQAGRWIAAEIQAGSRIGVEAGGFSMQSLISAREFTRTGLNMGTLFATRGYLGCAAAANFLAERVLTMDYIAAVDVNRYRQFRDAPGVSPVASAFYRRLWDGTLGFERVQRFKVYPHFLGVRFADDAAEPSFLGYDHPAVSVFRRREDAVAVWADWQREVVRDPRCADAALGAVGDLFHTGDWPEVLAAIRNLCQQYPDQYSLHFIEAMVCHYLGDVDGERQAMGRYLERVQQVPDLFPWATSTTLLVAGLPDVSLAVLRHGAQWAAKLEPGLRHQMANSFVLVGGQMQDLGYLSHAATAYRLAVDLAPGAATYIALGMVEHLQGRVEESSQAYQRAIELDSANAIARTNYGWTLYLKGRPAQAEEQFRQALALGSQSAAAFNLGLVLLAQGREEEALKAYGQAVVAHGAEEAVRLGAVEELRAEVERGGGVGRTILQRYWDAGPDSYR